MRALLLSGLIGLWAMPALALTADELWRSWQDMASGDGLHLTAKGATHIKDGLRLTDLRFGGPDEDHAISLTGSMTLMNEPDGSVTVHPDAALHLLIDAPDNPVEAQMASVDASLRITQDLNGQAYALRAKKLTLAFAADAPADAPMQELAPGRSIYLANFSFEALDSSLSFARNPPLRLNAALKAARVRMDSTEEDSAAGIANSDQSDTQDLAMTLAATLPASITWAALQAPSQGGGIVGILGDGFSLKLASQQAGYSTTMNEKSPDLELGLKMNSRSGRVNIEGDATGFGYDLGLNGVQAQLSLPEADIKDVPFSFTTFTSSLHMPLTDAQPAPFQFHLKLQDLATDATGWARLDSAQAFGHDPVQMQIDLDGKMTMQTKSEDPVVFVHELTVQQLLLKALGADVTAKAALSFKPGDDFPLPVGTASARLVGVQKVIDSLINSGVVPSEMATGLRFGLAMVTDKAKDAGPDDDVLESRLDARADGSIYINNQKLR